MNANRPGLIATTFVLSGLLLGTSAPASAATVTLCGSSVCYEYDDAQSGLALFGAPTLVGDSLRFLPTEFLAAALSSGAPVDLTTATFLIDRAYSVGGAPLADVSVTEVGDYLISGSGSVSANLFLLVANNDSTDFLTGSASTSTSGNSGGLQLWDLAAAVSTVPVNGAALFNDVAISIQNTLVAALGAGAADYSLLQKKAIFVSVNAVPLPATVWLMLTGILVLGRRVWRRTRT